MLEAEGEGFVVSPAHINLSLPAGHLAFEGVPDAVRCDIAAKLLPCRRPASGFIFPGLWRVMRVSCGGWSLYR